MAQERRNPLPVGKYWVDVFEPDWAMFTDWLDRNRGIVRVLVNETHSDETPKRVWYLFEVNGGPGGEFLPVWDGPGFPTIAGTGISSSQDTSTASEALDEINKRDKERWETLGRVAIGLTVVTGIWGVVKLIREIRGNSNG